MNQLLKTDSPAFQRMEPLTRLICAVVYRALRDVSKGNKEAESFLDYMLPEWRRYLEKIN